MTALRLQTACHQATRLARPRYRGAASSRAARALAPVQLRHALREPLEREREHLEHLAHVIDRRAVPVGLRLGVEPDARA